MPNLSIDFCGIKSPNPFWVASGPPSNTAGQAHRAFEAGWGGLVWKTIGKPIINLSSLYSAVRMGENHLTGFSNIELTSTRSIDINFKELREVKKHWPDRVVVASLITDTREHWHELIKRAEDAGADAVECNLSCPHGMCERGMGSVVGQRPAAVEETSSWCSEISTIPVIIKLTPNITDITVAGRAAISGGASALSAINTINSITGINLDTFCPEPLVDGKSTAGGYSGPAIKPIALNMIHKLASDPNIDSPLSGIGGISSWKDGLEFILLGATSVQVCTAIMLHGFRIVEDMLEGLSLWMKSKDLSCLQEIRGKALPQIGAWEDLNLNYAQVAQIDYSKCIGCNNCYIACKDGANQSIDLKDPDVLKLGNGPGRLPGKPVPVIRQEDCIGCNLCALACPIANCITLYEIETGKPPVSWKEYPSKGKAN